jgi:hypothetical protein
MQRRLRGFSNSIANKSLRFARTPCWTWLLGRPLKIARYREAPPFWTRRYRPIHIEASEAAGATVQAAVDSTDVNLARFCAQLGSRAAISQI